MNMELSPIGNCATAALVDRKGAIVWWCYPHFDGDPVFCRLLMGDTEDGFMDVRLDDEVEITQHYRRNTAILETVIRAGDGSAVRIIDFAPRFRQFDRSYRPPMLMRRIEPLAGYPRIRIRIRPRAGYGRHTPRKVFGSNHIRFQSEVETIRVTTDAPAAYIDRESPFVLTKPVVLVLGADEVFPASLAETAKHFEANTEAYWFDWCRNLTIPFEWQEQVLRSAITLRLSAYEETGAVVAAMTTSIPEAPNTVRNWDYRACWLRDAYFTVRALNQLGATRTMEGFLAYMRAVIAMEPGGDLKPVYGIVPFDPLEEVIETALPGYRGMGPVRRGNAAQEQIQNDVYGAVVLANTQWFYDQRLPDIDKLALYREMEKLGERAAAVAEHPDAGIWEYRGRLRVHTSSVLMCWAAVDRLARIAGVIGLSERARHWSAESRRIRDFIERNCWSDKVGAYTEAAGSDGLDASVLLMADLGYLAADDPRFVSTVEAIERRLMRGGYLLRYDLPDDFGDPESAFIVCNFWYVQALQAMGRTEQARAVFNSLLKHMNPAGLLSEDLDPRTGELWGNFPQTYSLVGTIICAAALSRPWNDINAVATATRASQEAQASNAPVDGHAAAE
ncbi:glycoside hydrolase family 15 protein [Methyloraptor flagellatus]|uniref:Glycoside hydrolase family 15 protein n=1 Tax=Methyloraptor flagellatus TaxID=3162530 RepID=A0AAU7X5P1_9HYPH